MGWLSELARVTTVAKRTTASGPTKQPTPGVFTLKDRSEMKDIGRLFPE